MRLNRNHQRAICASLVIVAFFIPAYGDKSALELLFVAISSAGNDSEITLIDVLIFLLPLLMIPLTAFLILIRAFSRKPLNSLLLGFPFFSLAFFFLILSFDTNRQVSGNDVFGVLKEMRMGFYITAFASLLLLLSYSRREALNLSKRS